MSHPDLAGISTDAQARERRLRTFTAKLTRDDADMVASWRARSPAEHATAGAQLSDMAARIAVQTGLGKEPALTFPPLSSLLQARGDSGS